MASKMLSSLAVRNPRNLERLSIVKPVTGYQYEKDSMDRRFIYRVEIMRSGKHTTGNVIHHRDGPVLTCSTREWPIASRLYSFSLVDVSAAKAVGSVLAYRCLKAGITSLNSLSEDMHSESVKTRTLLTALEEGGVEVIDPEAIVDDSIHDHDLYALYGVKS